MFYIDYDDLGMEIVAETIQHGGLEPDMRANTFEMTEEVKEALKSGNDSRLYSVMWDIYNDNNSCVAIQSFNNWMEEVNGTEGYKQNRSKRKSTFKMLLNVYFMEVEKYVYSRLDRTILRGF